ncbi:MAG: thiolase domain-containing protein [Nitrososphaerota archaeon]
MKDVYVVGANVTKVGEHWEKSLENLAAESALTSLDRSGVSAVDQIIVSNLYGEIFQEQSNVGGLLAEETGLLGVPALRVEAGGISGLYAVSMGVQAIHSGYAKVVLVTGVEKMSDATPEEVLAAGAGEERAEYLGQLGVHQAAEAALLYREYMRRHRVTQEDIAYFPVLDHENASKAHHAQYPFPVKLEAVLNSPYLAEPIHRLEAAAPSDGAASVILCSGDAAQRLDTPKCRITGLGFATDIVLSIERRDPLEMGAVRIAVERALQSAGVERANIRLLELFDNYSIMAPLCLEAAGFAPRGRAAEYASKETFSLSGPLPINTFGGLKARGHPVGATGVYQVAEGAMQLTEQAGKNQVYNASAVLVISLAGLGAGAGAVILEAV